jgi:hypothetical protein
VVIAALVAAFLPIPGSAIERGFSNSIYPPVQRVVTTLTNALPFALFDLLLILGVIAVGRVLGRAVRDMHRTRGLMPGLRAIRHLGVAGAIVYLVFLAMWGFNYRRLPMADRLIVTPELPGAEAVVRLGLQAVSSMNALHGRAHAQGWSGDEWQDPQFRRAFESVQRALSDAPPPVAGRLKATVVGPYFRWTGVDGMVNPFGLEVLANPDLLPFERPFVAAHEWSHLAGYADESEANFVGWLACLRGDVGAQYSGWLYLYWQVSGEVSQADRTRLTAALAAGPRRDVDAIVARLRRGQWPMLRTAGWAVYDQYLKANRVDEGIRSYGAVVTLILQARFEDDWTPVRRPVP